MTNIEAMSPAQIDEQLFALYLAEAKAVAAAEAARVAVRRAGGDEQKRVSWNEYRWTMPYEAAEAAARAVAASDRYEAGSAQRALGRLDAAVAAATEARQQAAPLHDEYDRRGGWTRAFLVQSANGHVHSSMGCSTCNRMGQATSFAWMYEYSGRNEDEIVEAAGERACTVCYPSAPVGVLSQPTKMFGPDEIAAQQAREQREAEKRERDAAKAAKAIKAADGSVLRDTHGFEIKTEVTARNTVVAHIADHLGSTAHAAHVGEGRTGYALEAEWVAHVIEALAAKQGKPVDEVREFIEDKARKKARKDWGYPV